MLRGFATISYWADDLEAAKDWYAELLGAEPYFSVPMPDGRVGYYEFRIGDHQAELGLIDSGFAPAGAGAGPGGVIMYWHVDDVAASLDRLLSLGAKEQEGVKERGEGTGFVTASVIDPFGNILGIMYNPHYLEILEKRAQAS
ncbi:VOC family protein [Actinomadura sp. 9N407]|uniref:VOC family protein n=1 Tax=Actinomadura sp. 9N407 TaxID=3375154 RepID=UPI0037ADD64B